ncbi:MAG: tRNA pseudouridine(55) synthase TruB [Ghiorsea sp.]
MSKLTQHPCGVVFFDKPKGWTSRQAVNFIIQRFSLPEQKKRKQRPKAGHAGTLDPLATGMLPILVGEATRFAELGLNAEKCYEVSLDLSFQTDTLDLEGEVLSRFDVKLNAQDIMQALQQFRGLIQQVPPIYSAIRVDGKRAHAMARKGEDVQLKAREVEIKQLDLLGIEGDIVTLRVACSKGTYIRSLARDLGQALACGGCVTMLRRISSGGWPEAMMVGVAELEENKEACILPLPTWLRDLAEVSLTQAEAVRFVQGQRLVIPMVLKKGSAALCRVLFEDQMLGTAMFAQRDGDTQAGVLQPHRVLPSAQEKLR